MGFYSQALPALESPAEGYAKRWSSPVVPSFRPGYARECWGRRSFDRLVRHDVDTMLARATPDDSPTVTDGMLESLPPPVQRYLSYAGVVGKPVARTVHLAQSGRMRLGPGQPWLSLRAKQYYSVQPPAFVWDGIVRAGPVPIGRARDVYVDGKGSMLVKALSLFGVVDAQGEEIDQGAMMRYLSEMVWFPSAFLLGNVSFEAVDEGSARVTLTDQGRTASGTLTIDPDGRLTGFVAQRHRMAGGSLELETWWTPVTEYGERAGLRLPVRGKAVWRLADGDFEYIDVRVDELVYERGPNLDGAPLMEVGDDDSCQPAG